jgi:AraC-like DNA-binding protein
MAMTLLSDRKNISTLIDNRTAYNGDDVQLCVYDTYQTCEKIPFFAEELMFCAMFDGKKIMHHNSLQQGKAFVPGQSFVIGKGEHVAIDFPEATIDTPTTCITIEVDDSLIKKVAEQLNMEHLTEPHNQEPTLQLNNNQVTQSLYQRLVNTFSENQEDRGMFIQLGITELLIRMLRDKSCSELLTQCLLDPSKNELAAVVNFIKQNALKPIDIDELCKVACMGRTKLFQAFRNELDTTPQSFILQQRLEWAAKQLKNGQSITSVCYDSGFNDPSHFSRRFKQAFSQSPKQFQLANMN